MPSVTKGAGLCPTVALPSGLSVSSGPVSLFSLSLAGLVGLGRMSVVILLFTSPIRVSSGAKSTHIFVKGSPSLCELIHPSVDPSTT